MGTHFVWATHERLPLICEEDERRLYRHIEAVCRDMRCDVIAIGGVADHVHLFINLGNTVSLADVMKRVKGASSRFMTADLHSGQWFQWQAHYGAFAVCTSHGPDVKAYVLNQKEHHSNGTTWPELEETCVIEELPDETETP
jgi:REP element-mobilizing transposase RayT